MSSILNNTKKRFKKKIRNAKSQGNNSYKKRKRKFRKNKTENKRKKRHFKNQTVKNKKKRKILFRVKQKIMNELNNNIQGGAKPVKITTTTVTNGVDKNLIQKAFIKNLFGEHNLDFVQYSF